LGDQINLISAILSNLTPRSRFFWFLSILLGIGASALEVASAAIFSLLTSSLFGGRKSNFGILSDFLPFSITSTILISILGVVFGGKLLIQWVELILKTKASGDFYNSLFHKKIRINEVEILDSDTPLSNIAGRMHAITHNIYYPAGLIISELLVMVFLIPFVIVLSPKASILVFGVTLILSIPALRVMKKKIQIFSIARSEIDQESDRMAYLNYRIFFDLGRDSYNSNELIKLNYSASEIDRKIVKLGSYSRLMIELSFIISVMLTFILIDELVPLDARIQFFAVLAYSFFRVIPAFTRIVSARNQISIYRSEFMNINEVDLSLFRNKNIEEVKTFKNELQFVSTNSAQKGRYPDITVKSGDKILIKGATGAGKTSFLRAVGGLTQGNFEVLVDGLRLGSNQCWKPSIAIVSQTPFLIGNSIVEMVTGKSELTAPERKLFENSISMACLESWGDSRTDTLTNEKISGGERKQIALARAIYSKPEILMLDELTAGMDQNLAKLVLDNLFNSKNFKAIFLTTHDFISEENFTTFVQIS
jgi:ATP-binding cassette subfamily C protein